MALPLPDPAADAAHLILIHAAGGQAISRFFSDLSGQGLDLVFDPDQQQSYLPLAWGGYVTYEHHWSEKVFSNFTYGTLFLETKDYSPDETYFRGGNLYGTTRYIITSPFFFIFIYLLHDKLKPISVPIRLGVFGILAFISYIFLALRVHEIINSDFANLFLLFVNEMPKMTSC